MQEESDRVIVPVNQPNKGGGAIPPAEAGEGRARTKENTGQDRTHPTQGGGKRVSQGLSGVRRAAEGSEEERFTALLHILTLSSALTPCIQGRSR